MCGSHAHRKDGLDIRGALYRMRNLCEGMQSLTDLLQDILQELLNGDGQEDSRGWTENEIIEFMEALDLGIIGCQLGRNGER